MFTLKDYSVIDTGLSGNVKRLLQLLEQGESLESTDRYGNTLLSRHAYRGEWWGVSLVLTLGANSEHKNHYGKTALDMARDKLVFTTEEGKRKNLKRVIKKLTFEK